MLRIDANDLQEIINKLITKADKSTKPTVFVNGYYEAIADFQEEIKKLTRETKIL